MRGRCWWTVLGLLIVAPVGTTAQSAQFRGEATHTGSVQTRGVERLGGVAWRFQTGGAVRSSAALVDGVLYVGSADGWLYALRATSGELVWRYDAGAPIASSAAVTSGIVLFGSRDNVLHGISASGGRSLWRMETGDDLPLPWGDEGWDYIQSSPAVFDGTAYWGSGDGHVYAVDPATGRQLWSFRTGGRVRSTPAVSGDLLVVGSADGYVYALDPDTGRERWRFETAGVHLDAADFGYDRRQIFASPTIADDFVYVGSRDASLYALRRQDGTKVWGYDEGSAWIMATTAVVGDRVYSARSSSGNIRAIDRSTGEEIWRFASGGAVFSSPVVAEGVLYAGQGDGDVSAIDGDTGELLWSYRTGRSIYATPAVHDGRVYVGSDDGTVYALQAADGPGWRRGVYFDADFAERSALGAREQHGHIRDYFANRGYDTLNAAGLEAFLEARIVDRAPSVVVFAMDGVPDRLINAEAGDPLMRRYLKAGGKVVWMGFLPGYFVRDPATGRVTGTDRDRAGALLDVELDAYDGDQHSITPTDTGRIWGLDSWWVGSGTTLPTEVTEVLAVDAVGRAAAWVKSFGGPAGTGFVLARSATSQTILSQIQRVAEYGLAGVNRGR